MGFKCIILGHNWNRCKCERCGATRDVGHQWSVCEGKCTEKCSICGKERGIEHKWDGCKCEICGATRDKMHKWVLLEGKCIEKCSVCGKERNTEHKWDGGKCKRCGKIQEVKKNTNNNKYPRYTGSGVCDVCNCSLTGVTAYIVPNRVFYNSNMYRTHVKNSPMMRLMGMVVDDAYFAQMQARDNSAGSAVCENCIHMF